MSISDKIQKLPYWDKLTENEREYILSNTIARTYEKGTVMHGCGEVCLGMLYILSGSVRVLMLSEEGREITLFRIEKGDSCVISASCVLSQITFETQIIASEKTEVLIVSTGAFSELMEKNINVRCFAYELATRRFSSAIWVMQQIIFARFDQRLSAFLISQYEKTGNRVINMTQAAIAQEVNTAREVVSRMLKAFASDGLIEIKRGAIALKNIEGLYKLI